MQRGLTSVIDLSECRRVPINRAPPPASLAAWAEGESDHVALLEFGAQLGSRPKYAIVAYGAAEVAETYEVMEAYESVNRVLRGDCRRLPCRDMALGVVGYEAAVAVEPWLKKYIRKHHPWPVTTLFMPEALVIYNYLLGHVTVCADGNDLKGRSLGSWRGAKGPIYETPRRDYMTWVEEALKLLDEGEFIQVVLSRVERYEYSGSPLALYRELTRVNPSPYMFYMRLGKYWIIGSSPELLVKMEERRLVTHPIAGTRARGGSPEEDLALENELVTSEKEIAEHLMLVDLARNDLGRVALPGTVHVTRFMEVEKYSSVQHMASRVEAVAPPTTTYADVLAAVNPAGTVSGAPKPRAMKFIALMEDEPRGPYAGAVGIYAKYAGETAIVIRSLWGLDNGVLETRAGAGIVYDSVPEKEYLETKHKLAAIHSAMGVRR